MKPFPLAAFMMNFALLMGFAILAWSLTAETPVLNVLWSLARALWTGVGVVLFIFTIVEIGGI